MNTSALYAGTLAHHRGGSVKNNFKYAVYTSALALDEIEDLGRSVRLFSHNRSNLFTLRSSDYALCTGISAPSKRATSRRTLMERALARLKEADSQPLPDRLELVTQLRVFGYVFNPVSFFLGWRDDRLVSVIAEINNTYDQTYSYILDSRCRVEDPKRPERTCFVTPKRFFVSPFIGDRCEYEWSFSSDRRAHLAELDIRMRLTSSESRRPFFAAKLGGRRQEFSDRNLLKSFIRLPFLPAQITSRIHLQALRLRALGLQYRRPLANDGRDP